VKTIKGDLVVLAKEGKFDVISHGCNCFCNFGAGIAKSIKQNFPQAYAADLKTCKGNKKKLGSCSVAEIDGLDLTVVNSYTQFRYGRDKMHVDYKAVRKCMKLIAECFPRSRIGLPKIGAGLAGGDWNIILGIIEEEMSGVDVTIVEYKR